MHYYTAQYLFFLVPLLGIAYYTHQHLYGQQIVQYYPIKSDPLYKILYNSVQ